MVTTDAAPSFSAPPDPTSPSWGKFLVKPLYGVRVSSDFHRAFWGR
jgi:hypothetical protein